MRSHRLLITLLVVLTGGCLTPPVKDTERQYFVLDVARAGEPIHQASGATLEVRPLRVSPAYQGTGFVYRREELRYETDYYNEFFTSPGAMISQEVRDWLTDSGLFSLVLDNPSDLQTAYLLEGNVTALYGDYTEPGDPRGILSIRFSVIDDRAPRPRAVLQAEYRQRVGLAESSPQALVRAWNEALGLIFGRLESDLAAALINQAEP